MSSLTARSITLRSHLGAGRSSSSLATLYFALLNGDPEAAGVEPTTAGGYSRVAMLNDATLWGTLAAGDVSATSVADITWPALTALWSQAQVTHWAVYDNASGGNLVYSGSLASPIVPTGVGDVPRIPAGALTVQTI